MLRSRSEITLRRLCMGVQNPRTNEGLAPDKVVTMFGLHSLDVVSGEVIFFDISDTRNTSSWLVINLLQSKSKVTDQNPE